MGFLKIGITHPAPHIAGHPSLEGKLTTPHPSLNKEGNVGIFLISAFLKNMKKIYLIVIPLAIISIFSLPVIHEAKGSHYAGRLIGHILLQTESKGEAWYVYPVNGKRYSLGRPAEAFSLMKKLSMGAKHSFIANTAVFPARLSGMILLDVEKSGEAYFIYPGDLKKRYLGRPADAFKIMRELGKGISNKDLVNIPLGQIGEPLGNVTINKKILIANVPFTPQAPLGNWSDQRYQDGCEESPPLWRLGGQKDKA